MSKDKYELVCATAEHLGERNDCVLKAFSLALNIPYLDIQKYFKGKRHKRGGIYPEIWKQALVDLGFKTKKINHLKFGKTVRTFQRNFKAYHENFFKKQEFPLLVLVRGHLLPIIDLEVLDWSEGRCHRIQEVLEVSPVESTQGVGRQ